MIVEVEVHKGDHGFGIYFTRDESRVLVEGFVRAEDGTAGPAEDAGTIAVDDVLEQINGLDITHMAMVDVIYQLRAAPKGPNLLTFRRRDEHRCSDPCECTAQVTVSNNDNIDDDLRSPAWWAEFEKLQAAEDAKWSASILSEAEFCDHLYAESDAQHKSYLRQQYPVLMAKFQASFDVCIQAPCLR
ncbi:hypothetical protein H310_10816 [Aphanomyces invadans]|uniref:PDZ domain-containing protein n=1 Tax=Aphanomyces invadans TaxID=157072 RepID=A0A024TP11_9STRA|nr:hypothetical protein H310_10816 [Aphanomyces invadans]ETV95744.1 hypothetical protein H310_10816 [Aphanomyces invadans]|eukprot:XP_008875495.1 hypothetical protein H310_10816 [Aphanomyces invadans]